MKKSTIIIVLAALLLAVLASCASTNHGVAMAQNKKVVGKNGIKRPDWVVQDVSTKKYHYATGYGTGKTFEVAKQKAQLAADAELALWVSTSVEAVKDRYLENSIIGEAEKYIDKFTSTASEKGQAVLSGIVEMDYWEDADGGVYVLKEVNVANVKAQIAEAINTTCADKSLFAEGTDTTAVLEKLNKVLDAYFPTK